ncbi:MAG: hypothetical protein M1812_005776 [Candelaria pacifica]|nr:MAG: hypothetical protein M1812_005776 [Candelaria pacifica]
MSPKSVLIVGGGPSGLVAAKTLLHSHPGKFKITILEKHATIGGLWPISPEDNEGMVNPEMPTNMSKHTVCFSDFDWGSVDLGEGGEKITNGDGKREGGFVPMFPKAWHVGRYLEAYIKKWELGEFIRVNSEVVKAGRERYGKGEWRWDVEWMGPKECNGDTASHSIPNGHTNHTDTKSSSKRYQGFFDYLVVATGFFNIPKIPKIPGLDLFRRNVKTIHSSQFRTAQDLVANQDRGSHNATNGVTPSVQSPAKRRSKVVVVGGSASSAEIAAPVALEISSAIYSPKSQASTELSSLKVHQIASRPSYIIPPILPFNPQKPATATDDKGSNPAPTFLPLDLCLYNLTGRPDGPISAFAGEVPEEIARGTHKFLQTLLGGRQEDLDAEPMTFREKHQSRPPHGIIDEKYNEFVRAGDIKLTAGRATKCGVDENGNGTITVSHEGKETLIDDIAYAVFATGFEPHPTLSWLSEEVKEILEVDKDCDSLPLILQKASYCHHAIPEIGFVGMYEGPYWGIMEMQARLVARNWAGDEKVSNALDDGKRAKEELKHIRKLRQAMKNSSPGIPQAWMSDYVGFIEEIARELHIERLPLQGEGHREGPVMIARYSQQHSEEHETLQGIRSIEETLRSSKEGRLVGRAAFRALQGKWKLTRQLKSAIASFPSGEFTGTAHFHPRLPTQAGFDAEYLYVEEGDFVTENGMRMSGSRRYVYRLNHEIDKISVWFVKGDDGLTADYLFNELEFEKRGGEEGWVARGDHLCESDQYHSQYLFAFRAVSLERLRIGYSVKGPKKEYVSQGEYSR